MKISFERDYFKYWDKNPAEITAYFEVLIIKMYRPIFFFSFFFFFRRCNVLLIMASMLLVEEDKFISPDHEYLYPLHESILSPMKFPNNKLSLL